MKSKALKKLYEIFAIVTILIVWYGLIPCFIFEVESTAVVVGFFLISAVVTVNAGCRIVKAAKAIGEIQNEESD